MGITGLWEVIGEGEVWLLADYATRHFKKHNRPLRIAVDEACWRFTNLTPEQVQKIREGEPAANPIEKVILWRILRLLKLNIQLIFVNDGPRRPWKRGKRGGGKLDFELVRLTRQLLDHLKVPHHRAPGEAEAECARLQALGVVDAVWSDDGDALMFGCGTLIRQHKIKNQRIQDQIRVYHAQDLEQKHDLDAESLVLFAVLSGGDYDTQGLRGCGPKTAALLAKRQHGLAGALCHASESDLQRWRQTLQDTMSRHDRAVEVPWTFPDCRALNYYCNPTVSAPEELRNLRGLRHGWDRPIDQIKLRVFLRERFHFTTREYMKHITPILLTRRLARATQELTKENLAFNIQLKRTRAKQSEDDESTAKSEVKITFSPMPVVEIDLSEQPPEEDWSKFAAKDGTPYDPTQNLDSEILRCFLQHGLPDGAFSALPEQPKPSKRKKKVVDPTLDSSPPSKKARSLCNQDSLVRKSPTTLEGNAAHDDLGIVAEKRGRPRKEPMPSKTSNHKPVKRTKREGVKGQPALPDIPPAPVFKQPRDIPHFNTPVLDLCTGDSDSDHCELPEAMTLPAANALSTDSVYAKVDKTALNVSTFVPGEVISAQTLRALRAASDFLRPHTESRSGSMSNTAPHSRGAHDPKPAAEVIDLT